MNKTQFSAMAVFILSWALAGCFALSHREEITFLQDLAENQNRMQAYVKEEERLFSELVSDIENNRLKSGTPESRVASLYGEPISCRTQGEDKIKELCVYRRPVQNYPADLVYLYFDENKNLSGWQVITAER
jgi:hypothetical protein